MSRIHSQRSRWETRSLPVKDPLSCSATSYSPDIARVWLTVSGMNFSSRDFENNLHLRRIEESVLYQAMLDRAHQSLSLLCSEVHRALNPNFKVAEPRRGFELFRRDVHFHSAGCQLTRAQILGRIKGRTSAERAQKEFRRSHARICAAILSRLIADD